MIPGDILIGLLVTLWLALAWLVLRWIGPKLAAMRVRRNWPDWPVDPGAPDGGGWEDCGDQGGIPQPIESRRAVTHPRAPDTGSGLLGEAGHPTAGQKIIAGLEDAVAHARGEPGRVKVTHYPRKVGD